MHSSKRSIPIFELLPIHHDFTMKDIISEQLQKNKLFKSLRYILLQRKMLVFSAFCTKIRVIFQVILSLQSLLVSCSLEWTIKDANLRIEISSLILCNPYPFEFLLHPTSIGITYCITYLYNPRAGMLALRQSLRYTTNGISYGSIKTILLERRVSSFGI